MMSRLMGLILLLFAGQAYGSYCNGTIQVDYNPAEVIEQYAKRMKVYLPIEITVSNRVLNCGYEIWIEGVDTNTISFQGAGKTINGKLLDDRFKRIKAKKGIFKVDLWERTTLLWVKLTHFNLFPAGEYTSAIKVSVVDYWDDPIDEQFLLLDYYSEPKISIELDNNSKGKVYGSDGDYYIDLGELTSNKRFNWGVNVLSNSAYEIVVDSEFDGLRHETNRRALIDYTLGFDNVNISSSEQLRRSYDFSDSVKNTWFGFSFTLGDVELMPAGYYEDNISLTIYPY